MENRGKTITAVFVDERTVATAKPMIGTTEDGVGTVEAQMPEEGEENERSD